MIIERLKRELGVKVEVDSYSSTLLTMVNGRQWSGAPMTPELARMTIDALTEYLANTEQSK